MKKSEGGTGENSECGRKIRKDTLEEKKLYVVDVVVVSGGGGSNMQELHAVIRREV